MRRFLTAAVMAAGVLGAQPAAAELSAASQDFVRAASNSQQFEALASGMVGNKSRNEQVIAFGREMAADYAAAQDELLDANSDAEDLVTKDVVDLEHQHMLDRLYAYSGPIFDRLYVEAQEPEHMKMVALFKDYAEHGDDNDLRVFAGERMAALKQNMEHARRLKLALPPPLPER